MTRGMRGVIIKFAIFGVVASLLGVLLVNTMLDGVSGATHRFTAQFSDVSGLRVGDDIRVAGVKVGRVRSIAVNAAGAEVDFEVKREQPVLDTTQLIIRYQNLLGQRYLAMTQAGERGKPLSNGATIPMVRTSAGFDLTELLNGFRPLFEVMNPDDVNALATTVVKVLQGEGGTVSRLLDQTAALTHTIVSRDEVFDEVLVNLTPVLERLAGQGGELQATVKELRKLVRRLAKDRQAIGDSIDGMSQLIGTTSQMLEDVRDPAAISVPKFRQTMELFLENEKPFVNSVRDFEKGLAALGRAGSYHSALNVYVCSAALSLGRAVLNFNLSDDGPWSEVCSG